MIEKDLGRIADALEQIVARFSAPPPQAAPVVEPTPEPEPEPVKEDPKPTELTLDALRKSLAPLDPAAGRALLGKFGVKKVSELKPEQYMEVLTAAREAR